MSVLVSDKERYGVVSAQDGVGGMKEFSKEAVEAKARLSLKPYRTFRELDQPQSDFIFRVKDGCRLALFEADGGAWKIAAIALISSWLANRIKTSPVAELAKLPIIS